MSGRLIPPLSDSGKRSKKMTTEAVKPRSRRPKLKLDGKRAKAR